MAKAKQKELYVVIDEALGYSLWYSAAKAQEHAAREAQRNAERGDGERCYFAKVLCGFGSPPAREVEKFTDFPGIHTEDSE